MKNPLNTPINRRDMLSKMSAASVAASPLFLQGCDSKALLVEDTAGGTATGSCVLTPTEDTGPYPLTSVLSNPAINRRVIHEGKPGVPVNLQLKLFDVNDGCAPITDAQVYIWHCDKNGTYSGYASTGAGAAGQIFCRGMQAVDENGVVNFDTIYPGWYPGRVTHMHYQIYHNNKTVTSQLAFPLATNREVYATQHYSTLGQNNTVTSLKDDFEFHDDGAIHQTVSISGDVNSGLVASLEIGIRG